MYYLWTCAWVLPWLCRMTIVSSRFGSVLASGTVLLPSPLPRDVLRRCSELKKLKSQWIWSGAANLGNLAKY
jgi:hypothetical protein